MEQPYVDTTNVGGNEYKIRDTEIRKILTPEYNTENSYTLDDLVMYEGKLYVCIEENQGIWNDTQWQEITLSEYLDFVNEKYLGLTKKLVQAIGVLENLQTAFKENLVGAVNENKTKIEAVSTDLASKIGRTYAGSLNDLRTSGLYWCTISGVTQRPVDSAGSVEVVTDDGSYVTQVYTALGNNQYIRGRNGATGNWSEWTHLASRDYADKIYRDIYGEKTSLFDFIDVNRVEFFGGLWYSNGGLPSRIRWYSDPGEEGNANFELSIHPQGKRVLYIRDPGKQNQILFNFLTSKNIACGKVQIDFTYVSTLRSINVAFDNEFDDAEYTVLVSRGQVLSNGASSDVVDEVNQYMMVGGEPVHGGMIQIQYWGTNNSAMFNGKLKMFVNWIAVKL